MPTEIVAVIVFLILVVLFLAWRLATSSTWKQLQLRRAAKMASSGNVEGMLRYLSRNMRRKSVSDPLTNAFIYFHIRSGNFDEAARAIEEAISLGDRSGMALAQLGYVAGGRGDRKQAEENYREAMERDPSLRGTMLVNISGMLIESGERLDEAEVMLREALELREGSARSGVHMNLALLHLKRKQPVEARVQAMTAYELIPAGGLLLNTTRANALAIASRACMMQGDRAEAASLASKALHLVEGIPGMEKMAEELRKHIPAEAAGRSPSR
jgi:Tfp pilus assembly protein PilF